MRLFFAIEPDPPARASLLREAADAARRLRGRPTGAANLHLTLAFLGEVEPARLPALEAIGATAAAAVAPFALRFDRAGGARRGGIAWIESGSPAPELAALHAELGRALASAGFPVEVRTFRPHVTLARRCLRAPAGRELATIEWRVKRLLLEASELRPEGPRYRELAAFTLGGSPRATGRDGSAHHSLHDPG